ncbi:MAG: UDP-N-acetylglucosamine pyrophosphorylase [Spartobacteria bacterium]|nr:UDP-N-acetylglucosamine pyrophosphorylase [Spartobacteria bacterium]
MSEDIKSILQRRGVQLICPEMTYIDSTVCAGCIEADVIIHPGCRLYGESLYIGTGSEIGSETPATVRNCQLGAAVQLKGGFFDRSVFLRGASMGSGAHVRPGCLIEEEAGGAHCVGLKQTILFPFVTLGSLINFCDAFMAGGTSRKNHSEVGSSYIHFNFTPHGDKATASLIGDVPRGVFLKERPIFLGGQGGMVGPSEVPYGTVIPAGSVWRGPIKHENHLCIPRQVAAGSYPYQQGGYHSIKHVVEENVHYLAQLTALRSWYRDVRSQTMTMNSAGQACYEGALCVIDLILAERIARLVQLAELVQCSLDQHEVANPLHDEQQRKWIQMWPEMKQQLQWYISQDHPLDLATVPAPDQGESHMHWIARWTPAAEHSAGQSLNDIVQQGVRIYEA